ncbi:MAG: hypothetical protein JSU04_08700 [Bdellovibrionales bacterium]|nr:hypothetical protein [Bdellovibrionales bacterium]
MRLLFLLTFSISAGLPRVVYAEKPTITWGFSDSRNLTGKAYARAITENHPLFLLLQKKLSDYNHEIFLGTVSRIENELKQRQLTCFAASTTVEGRVGFAYLTPSTMFEAPVLVLRKDMAEKFQGKGRSLSLTKIVQDKEMQGTLIEARYYGSKIDRLLEQAKGNIHRQVLAPIGANTIQMVASRRADYTVEFSFIIEGLRESGELNPDLYVAPVEEALDSLPMYVACSRTPEGLKAIRRIDEIIRKNVTTREYREAIFYARTPSKNYERDVDHFIKFRAKASEIH